MHNESYIDGQLYYFPISDYVMTKAGYNNAFMNQIFYDLCNIIPLYQHQQKVHHHQLYCHISM